RTEILLSPSRVTSAVLPSGVNSAWLGPDALLPKSTTPAGATVLPLIVNTETVPSERLATSASVPALLMETPAAPAPASNVVMTAGGDAFRSMTESLLSGTVFLGSAGSSLVAAVTSAIDSSGAIATLNGGPTTLAGALISWSTLGGDAARSMIVTLSAGGLAGTMLLPSTRTALPSLAEIASWAAAVNDSSGRVRNAAATPRPDRRHVMMSSRRSAWDFARDGGCAEPRPPFSSSD